MRLPFVEMIASFILNYFYFHSIYSTVFIYKRYCSKHFGCWGAWKEVSNTHNKFCWLCSQCIIVVLAFHSLTHTHSTWGEKSTFQDKNLQIINQPKRIIKINLTSINKNQNYGSLTPPSCTVKISLEKFLHKNVSALSILFK